MHIYTGWNTLNSAPPEMQYIRLTTLCAQRGATYSHVGSRSACSVFGCRKVSGYQVGAEASLKAASGQTSDECRWSRPVGLNAMNTNISRILKLLEPESYLSSYSHGVTSR